MLCSICDLTWKPFVPMIVILDIGCCDWAGGSLSGLEAVYHCQAQNMFFTSLHEFCSILSAAEIRFDCFRFQKKTCGQLKSVWLQKEKEIHPVCFPAPDQISSLKWSDEKFFQTLFSYSYRCCLPAHTVSFFSDFCQAICFSTVWQLNIQVLDKLY